MSLMVWVLAALVPLTIGAIAAAIVIVSRRSSAPRHAAPDIADGAVLRDRLAAQAAAQRDAAQGIAGQQGRSNQLF